LVEGYQHHTIAPKPEYQRGLAWSKKQQQLLVDSVLRGYPLPRFYFALEEATDPLGNKTTAFQIIDGYQRILALSGYLADHWALLDPKKERATFPRAIADAPCRWAGKLFSDLSADLQSALRDTALPVVLIEQFDSPDEVRDLFIRLQSGTALTRQQVRDAWPGDVGPYIEGIAGKLQRQPRFEFLKRLDRRGSRRDDDELDDPFHDLRVTAAQLLCLFVGRSLGGQIVAVDARALDDLYHSQTDFDPHGELTARFERLLNYCQQIIGDRAPLTAGGTKAKISKLRLFGLFLVLFDLEAAPDLRVDREVDRLADAFWDSAWWNQESGPRQGRATSRSAIAAYYHWISERVIPAAKLTHLDPRRFFDDNDKTELWGRSGGICAICQREMAQGSEEYDHITPWIRGGRTEVSNGRPVHKQCNRQRRDAGYLSPMTR
jgi:hypothetical protein